YDEHDAVMLLERLKPGASLRAVKDDEVAVSAAADVMRKIWRPLPQKHYPFPTVGDWGKGFARLRKLYAGATGPISPAMFDDAELSCSQKWGLIEGAVMAGDSPERYCQWCGASKIQGSSKMEDFTSSSCWML